MLPAIPNRAEGENILPEPRDRRRPGDTVAAFDVTLDLCSQAQDEPPLGYRLEVPRHHRRDHWTARKCYGHRRRQTDALGRGGREGQWYEWVGLDFTGNHSIEAEFFDLARAAWHRSEVELRGATQARINFAKRQLSLDFHHPFPHSAQATGAQPRGRLVW